MYISGIVILKNKNKLPLDLPFSLIIFPHFGDGSTAKFFEFLCQFTPYDDMMIGSEIFSEFLECPFDTVD